MTLKTKKKDEIKADIIAGNNNNQIVVEREVAPQTVQKIRESVPTKEIESYQNEQFEKVLKAKDKYLDSLLDADTDELKSDEKTRAFSAIDKSYHSTLQLKRNYTTDDMLTLVDRVSQIINANCPDCPKLVTLSKRLADLEG